VNDSIEDRISESWVEDIFMPISDGNLRNEDGGCISKSVVQEIHDFSCLLLCAWVTQPLVYNKELDPC